PTAPSRDRRRACRRGRASNSCTGSAGNRGRRARRSTVRTGASPRCTPTTIDWRRPGCPSRGRSRAACRLARRRRARPAPRRACEAPRRTPSGRPSPRPYTRAAAAVSYARSRSCEHSPCFELRDAFGVDARNRLHDLARVLADRWSPVRRHDVPRERDRRPHVAKAAELGMRQLDERTAPAKRLVALDEILDVLDDAGRDAFALQQLDELDLVALAGPIGYWTAAGQTLEALDVRVVERADRDPAILAARREHVLEPHVRIRV